MLGEAYNANIGCEMMIQVANWSRLMDISLNAASLSQYNVTLPEEIPEVMQIQCSMNSTKEMPNNSDM
jgi:hypothetical protein